MATSGPVSPPPHVTVHFIGNDTRPKEDDTRAAQLPLPGPSLDVGSPLCSGCTGARGVPSVQNIVLQGQAKRSPWAAAHCGPPEAPGPDVPFSPPCPRHHQPPDTKEKNVMGKPATRQQNKPFLMATKLAECQLLFLCAGSL